MAKGLFEPLYSQVDPLHVGEAGRAMRVAEYYGQRLLRRGNNIDTDTLESLISGYPAHDFVIDRWEAMEKFRNVREPSQEEAELGNKLFLPPSALFDDEGGVTYVSTEPSFGGDNEDNTASRSGNQEGRSGNEPDTETR